MNKEEIIRLDNNFQKLVNEFDSLRQRVSNMEVTFVQLSEKINCLDNSLCRRVSNMELLSEKLSEKINYSGNKMNSSEGIKRDIIVDFTLEELDAVADGIGWKIDRFYGDDEYKRFLKEIEKRLERMVEENK